jgi:rhodanese-related sulfurtransferase
MKKMRSPISPDELRSLLETKSTVLLDVRRKSDYETEPHLIPGAVWRDPAHVESWSRELKEDRSVVVYCVKGGSVSQSITETLIRKGINACYVEGGLKAWKEAGGPTK